MVLDGVVGGSAACTLAFAILSLLFLTQWKQLSPTLSLFFTREWFRGPVAFQNDTGFGYSQLKDSNENISSMRQKLFTCFFFVSMSNLDSYKPYSAAKLSLQLTQENR
mmetsp:Transcript_13607/g.17736  ORF Transcript_13607/g.17736 Transcript_13607/m.17736 type:complete len:108 (-) Transcript_13607:160-483(-)